MTKFAFYQDKRPANEGAVLRFLHPRWEREKLPIYVVNMYNGQLHRLLLGVNLCESKMVVSKE